MTGDQLRPGSIFAGYTIEARLGQSGSVYLAGHPRLPRRDALKVLSATDAATRARFLREAEDVARLDHPNIVAVHDRGIEQGRPWVAMRFVDGVDVAALIRRGPAALPVSRVLAILGQVARGVDAAHTAGVLHRELKPANILVESPAGEPDRVFVTDFGIARTSIDASAELGRLAYAAPEQLTGGMVDGRTTVYALGCILYEMLTGTPPFPGASTAEVARSHLTAEPPRATERAPALPARIDAVVATALAKDPARRFASAGELVAAAAAALVNSAPIPQAHGLSRRRRALVALAVSTALIVLIGAGTLALRGRDPESPAAAPTAPNTTGTGTPTKTTGTTKTSSWRAYKSAVELYPDLMPQTQAAQGYQGIRCTAVDSKMQPADVDAPQGAELRVSCTGDSNPVRRLTMICSHPTGSYRVQPITGMTVQGNEKWDRPSGSGRIIWGTYNDEGVVLIDFDRPSRSKCGFEVVGLTSGQALRDRWWPGAPL
ncbi:serine/threonine-protein kinase [Nocardia sp. NPDC003693]